MEKIRQKALNNAYCLLRQRPRSEQEIRKRLRLKGYEDDIVNEVVLALKNSGELDDAKFAKLWVDARIYLKENPKVLEKLEKETRAKGDAAVIPIKE